MGAQKCKAAMIVKVEDGKKQWKEKTVVRTMMR